VDTKGGGAGHTTVGPTMYCMCIAGCPASLLRHPASNYSLRAWVVVKHNLPHLWCCGCVRICRLRYLDYTHFVSIPLQSKEAAAQLMQLKQQVRMMRTLLQVSQPLTSCFHPRSWTPCSAAAAAAAAALLRPGSAPSSVPSSCC
jgi:hypothetical protein